MMGWVPPSVERGRFFERIRIGGAIRHFIHGELWRGRGRRSDTTNAAPAESPTAGEQLPLGASLLTLGVGNDRSQPVANRFSGAAWDQRPPVTMIHETGGELPSQLQTTCDGI